jgi:hypothetical protein
MDAAAFDRLAKTLVVRRAVMRTLFGITIGAGVGQVDSTDAAKHPQRRKGKRRERHHGDQNSRKRECGGAGDPCCQKGACAGGRICQGGICADAPPPSACGEASQPCCHAGACAGGLVCRNNATCEPCGARNEPCCGSHCAGGLTCIDVPSGNICQTCGFSRTPCCPGGTCRQGTCIPIPNHPNGVAICEEHCGGVDQPCCHQDVQSCGVQALCVAGTCVACGLSGDPCCAGSTCHACRTCNNGSGICDNDPNPDC